MQEPMGWISLEPKAGRCTTYDTVDYRWDVIIIRDGVEVKPCPAHIVLATGSLGWPVVPDVCGVEDFEGQIMRSSRFLSRPLFSG